MNARDLTRKPKSGPRECPGCGLVYNRFRCAHSFKAVQSSMKTHNDGRYRSLRRRGVLGHWHQLKTFEWSWHIEACAQAVNQPMQEAA